MKTVVVDKVLHPETWGEYAQEGEYRGGSLRWYKVGDGDPQVLFMHGLSGSAQSWDCIPFRLQESGISSLVVDLPGHGESYTVKGEDTPHLMADLVPWLGDQYGVKSLHLVGHSLGGGVALAATDKYQSKVRSLTLNASGGLGKDIHVGLRLVSSIPGSGKVLRTTVNRPVARAWRKVSVAGRSRGFEHQAIAKLTADSVEGLADEARMDAFVAIVRNVCNLKGQTINGEEAIERLGARRVKVITCEEDTILGSKDSIKVSQSTGAELFVFEGKSHEPHLVDRERFTQIVTDQVTRW